MKALCHALIYVFSFALINASLVSPCLANVIPIETIETIFSFAQEPAMTDQLSQEVRSLHADIQTAIGGLEESSKSPLLEHTQTQEFQDRINALFVDRLAVLTILSPKIAPSQNPSGQHVYRSADSSALEDLTMLTRLSEWIWSHDSLFNAQVQYGRIDAVALRLSLFPPAILGYLLGFLVDSNSPIFDLLSHAGGSILGVLGAMALFEMVSSGNSEIVWRYFALFRRPAFMDRYPTFVRQQVFQSMLTPLEKSLGRKLTRRERKKLFAVLRQNEIRADKISDFCGQLLEGQVNNSTISLRISDQTKDHAESIDSEGAFEPSDGRKLIMGRRRH